VRAVVCEKWGPPESLVVREVPEPRALPGQVVIDVRAAGVNFPDVLVIENKYQFKPQLPFTPGGEVAGVVSEVGEGVEGLSVGDRVLATTGFGAFAERVAARAEGTFRIPDGMDFPTAACFLMTYGTSHHALVHRAALRPGETLLVLGAAGGVGLAAVEIGKLLGARVIAGASSPEKLETCRERGADELVDYTREDLKQRVRELTGGAGADVVYDPVGGDLSEPALRATGWEGRFLVIGFASGTIPRIPLNLPLLKGCQIVGVFWGAFVGREPERFRAEVEELFSWFEQGRLAPLVSATYPLEEAGRALREMADRRVRGKVAVVIEGT